MIEFLKPFVDTLDRRAEDLERTHHDEAKQLRLVMVQCRQLLEAGHFIEADEILHQASQRIDNLTTSN